MGTIRKYYKVILVAVCIGSVLGFALSPPDVITQLLYALIGAFVSLAGAWAGCVIFDVVRASGRDTPRH